MDSYGVSKFRWGPAGNGNHQVMQQCFALLSNRLLWIRHFIFVETDSCSARVTSLKTKHNKTLFRNVSSIFLAACLPPSPSFRFFAFYKQNQQN